ncbi:MAG: response regulator [Candidatus Wallbacteria bacterium]|nr:response regulator [Candidatus Wallbacteria bacterium]
MEKRRILAIDDDLTVLKFIESALRSAYEISTLSFCHDIQNTLESFRPDLLLLDLKLPNNDGYELCQQIREYRNFDSIPVILMTGVDLNAIRNNYSKVGASDYLLKPFDADSLISKISSTFNSVN